ncbi:hypothetical protein [Mycobacterium sp.]|uniref:hypothetical protein n=1 Tax=Mycobacterium sp. TaxID=1785 RepID=UPI003A881723
MAIDYSSISLIGNSGGDWFDEIDTTKHEQLPPGQYVGRVAHGKMSVTRGGDRQYVMRLEVMTGDHTGKCAFKSFVFSRNAKGRSKIEIAAYGLTTTAALDAPFPEPGREYVVRFAVTHRTNDSGTVWVAVDRLQLLKIVPVEDDLADLDLPPLAEGGTQ